MTLWLHSEGAGARVSCEVAAKHVHMVFMHKQNHI
jgi:hypothetical protein